MHAGDLTLDKFIDAQTLAAAPSLPGPSAEVRTVLLTGATGFLGRYLALDWLERMDLVDGKVICLVRAKDDAAARERLDKTFDSGDPELLRHYRELAADHLEVIAGDKGEADLGLDPQTWQRLADTVDLIVDPAALVNHVLPYSQLFGPNALGTAELIRIALTTKQKPFVYVSTIGVGAGIEPGKFTEDGDIRVISATRKVDDSYANGYSQQQVGRRGAAARGPRPVRSAGLGVPLRHDPGRHHVRRPTQPARHVHPTDAEPGRHRRRARLVLRARRRRASSARPL